MNLDQIQKAMFHSVRQPLTPGERMRAKSLDGRSQRETAESIIKPNSRLTSFERLEIYNRQYWFRIISSMTDDFDGLQAILGDKQFQKLVIAYLIEHPSKSFTLRNLGSKLEQWLGEHLEYVSGVEEVAMDMVKLEWAEIEAFDGESRETVTAADLAGMGPDPVLRLQPYVRVLELKSPVHEFLLKVRERRRNDEDRVRRVAARYLPKAKKTFVAVHRLENSVYFKEVDTEAFAMLTALQRECAVSEAIEAADWSGRSEQEIGSAVRDHFANWASLGWFCKGTTE